MESQLQSQIEMQNIWLQNHQNGIFFNELSEYSEIQQDKSEQRTSDGHNTSAIQFEAYEQEMKLKVLKTQERAEGFKKLQEQLVCIKSELLGQSNP